MSESFDGGADAESKSDSSRASVRGQDAHDCHKSLEDEGAAREMASLSLGVVIHTAMPLKRNLSRATTRISVGTTRGIEDEEQVPYERARRRRVEQRMFLWTARNPRLPKSKGESFRWDPSAW